MRSPHAMLREFLLRRPRLPTSTTSKGRFKAGPGGAGQGSVAILAQVYLPQGWRTGVGSMSPSFLPATATGGGIFCSNPPKSLASARVARFGAKTKNGLPPSRQAMWHPLSSSSSEHVERSLEIRQHARDPSVRLDYLAICEHVLLGEAK